MCPYCGSDCFVSVTTVCRGPGRFSVPGDLTSKVIERTWENECSTCGKWSLYDEVTQRQLVLVDPTNHASEVVA